MILNVNERFQLRRWGSQDKSSLTKYANNEKVSTFLRDVFSFPYTESDADWWIKRNEAMYGEEKETQEECENFAIVDTEKGFGIGVEIGKDET